VRDKSLTITVVNPSVSEPRLAEIALRGATVSDASMRFLSDADIHAHNTFAQPDAVVPQTKLLSVSGGTLAIEFPPASVAAVSIQLS
jgi:alpha-N-arabinofuranosidase